MPRHIIDKEKRIALIGAGPMSVQYARVFRALGVEFDVYGRGAASAKAFEEATGIAPSTGLLRDQLAARPAYCAVVSVGVQDLAETTLTLCNHGCRSLLVEKPAAIDAAECRKLLTAVGPEKANDILIAYNRRFYPGVTTAKTMIEEDGGATSAQFRFTELAWKLEGIEKDPRVKANWLFANSTHVIDMTFAMIGFPEQLSATVAGGLDWHPTASRFVGHGISTSGALFSYHSDWDAPGGWGVEVFTRKRRIIFQPLETLSVQTLGSFAVEAIPLDVSDGLKMGLPEMVRSYLDGTARNRLPTLAEQAEHFKIFEKIGLGGTI